MVGEDFLWLLTLSACILPLPHLDWCFPCMPSHGNTGVQSACPWWDVLMDFTGEGHVTFFGPRAGHKAGIGWPDLWYEVALDLGPISSLVPASQSQMHQRVMCRETHKAPSAQVLGSLGAGGSCQCSTLEC